MTEELPGQLPLFDLDDLQLSGMVDVQMLQDMINEYGQACAQLAVQLDYGSGQPAIRAEAWIDRAIGALAAVGLIVERP